MALSFAVQAANTKIFCICKKSVDRPREFGVAYSVDEFGNLYIASIYSVERLDYMWTLGDKTWETGPQQVQPWLAS